MNSKKAAIIGINIFLLLIIIFCGECLVFQKEYEEWLRGLALLLVGTMILQVISLVAIDKVLSIFSIVFLVLTYLFHFSHVFLILTNYEFGDTINYYVPFVRFGKEITMESMQFSFYCVLGLYLGFLMALLWIPHRKKAHIFSFKRINSLEVGIFLILISLPFFLFKTMQFFIALVQNGYAYAVGLEYGQIVPIISNMMLPGLILWMTHENISRKKAFSVLVLGVLLRGFAMLTGQRAYNLLYILLLISIFCTQQIKIRFKTRYVVLLVICAYIGLDFLRIIRTVRVNGMSVAYIIDAVKNVKSNPIMDMLNEFGITENIVAYTYKMSTEPMHGMQLISALLSVIPGISYFFPNIDWAAFNLAESLDSWNMGGSFIADAYFDFHYGGIIFCFFLGLLIQKIFLVFTKALKERNMFVVAWLSLIVCDVLFCVRSTTYKIPRMILLYSIIYFIFIALYLLTKGLIQTVTLKADNR